MGNSFIRTSRFPNNKIPIQISLSCVCLSSLLLLASCGGAARDGNSVIAETPAPTPVPSPTPSPIPTPPPPTPAPPPPISDWVPAPQTSWQWQLTTPVDLSINVQMYDIDGFDNSATVVSQLHSIGRKAVCYIDVGTWENWRSDASRFPSIVKGGPNGWPGELWLDIRRLDLLGPLMTARLQMCKNKGFDAVEPDNVDGYSNATGFPLTYTDQIIFNTYIAQTAHSLGMSVALKNDLDQVPNLLPQFDFAIDEQCFEFSECSKLSPFTSAGKAIFEVEYNLPTTSFCSQANALNFNSLKKNLALDAYKVACR